MAHGQSLVGKEGGMPHMPHLPIKTGKQTVGCPGNISSVTTSELMSDRANRLGQAHQHETMSGWVGDGQAG